MLPSYVEGLSSPTSKREGGATGYDTIRQPQNGYGRGLQVALSHRLVGWTSNHPSLINPVTGPGEAAKVSGVADRC